MSGCDPIAEDERYMQHAIALAKRGRGLVEPNPMVGCVIVKDGRIIGEGFHKAFGQPHAEPNALSACTEDPRGATVYVTLEPCCHTGKKTPPCVPRLIAAGVQRVIVACADPNPAVAGNGLRQLREAGIDVVTGLCSAESKQLNAAFFASTLLRRPYVTLKWAQSADGAMGLAGVGRVWISNAASRRVVHELRARCDAILVGINTVRLDDPMLTVRDVPCSRKFTRVVLDTHLTMSPVSRLAHSAGESPVVVFCSEAAVTTRAADVLRDLQVEVVPVPERTPGKLNIQSVLTELGARSVTHLLVEPGPTLARTFLEGGYADRVWTFGSSKVLRENGDPLKAPTVAYPVAARADMGGDELTEFLNPGSEVFFASLPSVDLELAGIGRHGG